MMGRPLHTIGYEGLSIPDFLCTLRSARVELIIDVRELPLSRKPGFSKTSLKAALADAGIQYVHLRGLGDPKAGRTAAREGRIQDFRRIFNAHLKSAVAQSELAQAMQISSSSVACLLCFESDHRYCHRCIVADEMASTGGFKLNHLKVSHIHSFFQKDSRSHGRPGALA